MDIAALAKELKKWGVKKSKAAEDEKFFGSLVHEIETRHLPPLMEKAGTDDFNVPGLGHVQLDDAIYVNVKKEDREAFFAALRKLGHGALIVEQVNPKTLNKWGREELEAGRALPDQATVTTVPTAKLLKPRKKKHG